MDDIITFSKLATGAMKYEMLVLIMSHTNLE